MRSSNWDFDVGACSRKQRKSVFQNIFVVVGLTEFVLGANMNLDEKNFFALFLGCGSRRIENEEPHCVWVRFASVQVVFSRLFCPGTDPIFSSICCPLCSACLCEALKIRSLIVFGSASLIFCLPVYFVQGRTPHLGSQLHLV